MSTGKELLVNGSFEKVGPDGPFTSTAINPVTGNAAAASWTIRNEPPGTVTTTDLLATTWPGPPQTNSKMIHVTTTGPSNGLVQAYLPPDQGPVAATFSLRVFVVQGKVVVGLGNGGSTGATTSTSTIGKWETLKGWNFNSPANELIVYSDAVQFTDFYVDLASVTEADFSEGEGLGS